MTEQFSLGTQTGRRPVYNNRPFWDLPLKITYAGTRTERRSSYITPIPTTKHATIASLQHDATAIVVYEVDLAGSKIAEAVMRLNIGPDDGGMIDEMRVAGRPYRGGSLDLDAGTLIGWRVGRALVALRLLEARTTCTDKTAQPAPKPYRLHTVKGLGLCLDGRLTPEPPGPKTGNNLNCGFVIALATDRDYRTLADFLAAVGDWPLSDQAAADRRTVRWQAADATLELDWDSRTNRVASEKIDGKPVDRRLRYDSPLIRLADGESPAVLP
ncbi:MAG: hypothetical protein GXP27_18365 [Planctomycetes bacterium]|nr:hypothetical protein [Planctomycetota bacterium]